MPTNNINYIFIIINIISMQYQPLFFFLIMHKYIMKLINNYYTIILSYLFNNYYKIFL